MMRNVGTMPTSGGMSMVASSRKKSHVLPGNSYLAKAKPASEHRNTVINVPEVATMKLLRVLRARGRRAATLA